tara:strand:- start:103486 stop:104598 length:1113 start_codon:yes stop_codon:yes gene_type:complete
MYDFKKIICLFCVTFIPLLTLAHIKKQDSIQNYDSISIIFIGDIMGHDSQIAAAFNKERNSYNYDKVFDKISPTIKSADFAIANLEVTLAGPPYVGYPQFSSPDALAIACKKSGIDILVTANNHSCDKGKKGLIRTINILDSLNIPHTGTFKDLDERDQKNLLIFKKNNIKIGMLNYSYGTNGIPVPKPTVVNLIDKSLILQDINQSKKDSIDKLIVFIHWGSEYKSHPSTEQVNLANFLFENGVDVIIGSHPHVLQRMEFIKDSIHQKVIAYSLGNFVSAQRTRKRDGGAILKITVKKDDNNNCIISDCGYYLTWVNQSLVDNKKSFEILLCNDKNETLNEKSKNKMNLFISDSRELLNKENKNVNEIK